MDFRNHEFHKQIDAVLLGADCKKLLHCIETGFVIITDNGMVTKDNYTWQIDVWLNLLKALGDYSFKDLRGFLGFCALNQYPTETLGKTAEAIIKERIIKSALDHHKNK